MPSLDGVRVLDLTRLLPGAYATFLLAGLGADVIKVEDPRGGDPMRTMPRARAAFERLNVGKRSVTLNLRSPDAARVLDALASHADVLVESFRPSTAKRLGVDSKTLRERHPRLICASITGFGQHGPYAEVAAHDINYQALAGLLEPPRLPGALVGDIGSAMETAFKIAAALFARGRTGAGSHIDVSIHEAALAWSMFPTTDTLASARYNIYETSDRRWLALGALEEKFWAAFCERTGVPTAATVDDVRRVIATRTRDEWLAIFEGADACLTAVYREGEVSNDEHLAVRGLLSRECLPAPALGADTDALLEEAGIDAVRREDLRRHGVI